MKWNACLALFLGLIWGSAVASTTEDDEFQLFDSDGYRIQSFRSATPAHLDGVQTLTTESAYALWLRKSGHFVNVQPVLWRQGFFLPDQPLTIIPESDWLPNVGFGQLEELWADYLQHYAQQWDGMIIFYCTPDCWHSWNTAKRVAEKWPDLKVGWFRDGIDAWQEKGYPVEFLQQPLPMP